MKLKALLAGYDVVSTAGDLNTEIRSIAYDSRKVAPGSVFVAVRGLRLDGNRFVSQALENGAVAVVSARPASSPVVWVQVTDERAALAALSGNFYDHPTRQLHLVGVTGTNGKTTTTYLVESTLQAAGCPPAVLGTIEYRGPGFGFSAGRTTPESPDLQYIFRRAVDSGWKHAVMEVSSHAIELKRVEGLRFEVAVFTNLSRDHLDFHGNTRSYFLAKKRLFTGLDGRPPSVSVLNRDDACFEELRDVGTSRVVSYGMDDKADIYPLKPWFRWDGTDVTFRTPGGDIEVRSSLLGTPNLYNMEAAIGVGMALGVPVAKIKQGIENLLLVPGRFELVDCGQPFRVIVDYAHTDDALDKALGSAREITSGRLIVVFGCGGDRDKTKRPLMGKVAGLRSDFAVVTSDNPRTEDPEQIIQEIEEGLKPTGTPYRVSVDRRAAIRTALEAAKAGDTVLVAGKGHETYQVVGDREIAFDDRAVTRQLLDELNLGRNR